MRLLVPMPSGIPCVCSICLESRQEARPRRERGAPVIASACERRSWTASRGHRRRSWRCCAATTSARWSCASGLIRLKRRASSARHIVAHDHSPADPRRGRRLRCQRTRRQTQPPPYQPARRHRHRHRRPWSRGGLGCGAAPVMGSCHAGAWLLRCTVPGPGAWDQAFWPLPVPCLSRDQAVHRLDMGDITGLHIAVEWIEIPGQILQVWIGARFHCFGCPPEVVAPGAVGWAGVRGWLCTRGCATLLGITAWSSWCLRWQSSWCTWWPR